jgi:phage regulator Rha-like protein
MNNQTDTEDAIKHKIFSIRGVQVMLDSDLAKFYNVSTKRLNQQVNRNKNRFPSNFTFQLTEEEYELFLKPFLRLQFATSIDKGLNQSKKSFNLKFEEASKVNRGGRTYLPYVFTEQGVTMLSAVLRSDTAVNMSIQIVNAFVNMRKFIFANAQIFQRIDNVETKQIEYQLKTDKNFEKVFAAIEDKSFKIKQGIFFEGQIFEAHNFISNLLRNVKESVILVDNYIDDSVLILFAKIPEIKVTIYTKFTKQLELDYRKYKEEYNNVEIKNFTSSHDRFLIIDSKEIYHIGASLKDLGKKWFAFSRFDSEALSILDQLK